MIVNEVLSKNPLLLKNRIQSKNGCLENREDASVLKKKILNVVSPQTTTTRTSKLLTEASSPFSKQPFLDQILFFEEQGIFRENFIDNHYRGFQNLVFDSLLLFIVIIIL